MKSYDWGKDVYLPVVDLLRPEDYRPSEVNFQRDITMSRVDAIVEDFESRAFSRPVVSARDDGTFCVLDGYHRVVSADRLLIEDVPCTVHYGLTNEEESSLFVRLNKDRARVSQVAEFHAECVGKHEVPLKIDELLLRFGLDARGLDRDGTIKFPAIAPIRAAVRFGGFGLVELSLTAMKNSFTTPSRRPWWGNTRIVQGVTEFFATEKISPPPTLEEFDRIVRDEFVTPTAVWEAAMKKYGKMGGGTGSNGRRPNDAVVLLLTDRLKKLRRPVRVAA